MKNSPMRYEGYSVRLTVTYRCLFLTAICSCSTVWKTLSTVNAKCGNKIYTAHESCCKEFEELSIWP